MLKWKGVSIRYVGVILVLIPFLYFTSVLIDKIGDGKERLILVKRQGTKSSITEYLNDLRKARFNEILKSNQNHLYEKWIVLTSINPPTEDVKKLSKIKGWVVLVVGDTKSPPNWSWSNCIHLDVKKQLELGYETTKLLKFKSYARKNIGFLYAIQHGAKIIYETDDDNSPISGQIGFDPNLAKEYLMSVRSKSSVINPYSHFGQSSVWPRGYPLDKISELPSHQYHRCSFKNAFVQQGVVNGDPDVDAIFRLSRKDTGVNLNISFDSSMSPLLLPKGVMSPYNSQNTLHLYNAFWGLLLPQTVAFRVCDIWRGYWAQRLLWEIDGHLAFFPPNAFTVRNAHDYLSDLIDEEQMYHHSGNLVKFLVNWKSTKKEFFERVLELSYAMAENGFWGKDDLDLTNAWLTDLIRIGYRMTDAGHNKVCATKIEIVTPNEQPTSYLRAGKFLKNMFAKKV